ncbi:hypothetical protein [Sorangium sp. So ce1153]|uniref:hypothetical protein n=1 Tax=Sorangium sp. So ce1153 TaxID=3133333 RepID=UPI003F5D930A
MLATPHPDRLVDLSTPAFGEPRWKGTKLVLWNQFGNAFTGVHCAVGTRAGQPHHLYTTDLHEARTAGVAAEAEGYFFVARDPGMSGTTALLRARFGPNAARAATSRSRSSASVAGPRPRSASAKRERPGRELAQPAVRAPPVDPAHLLAQGDVEPAAAEQRQQRVPPLARQELLVEAGLDPRGARRQVGEPQRLALQDEPRRPGRGRERSAGRRVDLLQAARDERQIAGRLGRRRHHAIPELAASVQADRQIVRSERQRLLEGVERHEARAAPGGQRGGRGHTVGLAGRRREARATGACESRGRGEDYRIRAAPGGRLGRVAGGRSPRPELGSDRSMRWLPTIRAPRAETGGGKTSDVHPGLGRSPP